MTTVAMVVPLLHLWESCWLSCSLTFIVLSTVGCCSLTSLLCPTAFCLGFVCGWVVLSRVRATLHVDVEPQVHDTLFEK